MFERKKETPKNIVIKVDVVAQRREHGLSFLTREFGE